MATALAGFLFGLSLIVVIGAQNTFVLRQGALRRHVLAIVVVCAASDALLIAAGVAGGGAALQQQPGLLTPVRILGAAFLAAYGGLAARKALSPPRRPSSEIAPRASLVGVLAACLALTWLNPAVYLDTVVVLGAVANTHAGRQWWFGGGAAIASALWFTILGYGASVLSPLFRRPAAWRVLDGFVAVTMLVTAVRVLAGP